MRGRVFSKLFGLLESLATERAEPWPGLRVPGLVAGQPGSAGAPVLTVLHRAAQQLQVEAVLPPQVKTHGGPAGLHLAAARAPKPGPVVSLAVHTQVLGVFQTDSTLILQPGD